MDYKKRRLKVILFTLSIISVFTGATVLLLVLALFGVNIPQALLQTFLVGSVGLILIVAFLSPRRVHILEPGVVEILVGVRKARISGRVTKVLSTREVLQLVDLCPVGWRFSLDYSFYGMCSSDVGGVIVVSTPECSGTWLMIETGRRRYVVCCEDKDRERCRV